jgi:hypothetical protein
MTNDELRAYAQKCAAMSQERPDARLLACEVLRLLDENEAIKSKAVSQNETIKIDATNFPGLMG